MVGGSLLLLRQSACFSRPAVVGISCGPVAQVIKRFDESRVVRSRSYSNQVHDHFDQPRNVGSFDKNEKNIGTAIVGKAACGDVIKLQVKVGEDGIIKDAKFKTFGCGSAIASSSFATELIKGKSCEQALGVKNTDISHHLSLPPVKLHCSLLAEDAVKLAVQDYINKRNTTTKTTTTTIGVVGPEEANIII
eukprot:GHVS01068618.1.p1 GENE.GHVS01068618.1~~GHVS01068618.1.p1  ORF type:complete len:192 (-),score=30.76 GHVS01068618.1:501-1076(-)